MVYVVLLQVIDCWAEVPKVFSTEESAKKYISQQPEYQQADYQIVPKQLEL